MRGEIGKFGFAARAGGNEDEIVAQGGRIGYRGAVDTGVEGIFYGSVRV
jgi:hypothetical protein